MSTKIFFNLIFDFHEQGAEIIEENISLLNYRKEIENDFKNFYFAKISIENKPFKIEKEEENNFKIKDILYDECIYIFSLNYNLNSFKIYFYDKEVLINEQIDENLSLKYLRVSIDKNKKFSENYYFENNKKRLNFKKEENIKIKEIIINNDNKILLKNYFKLIISYQIKKNEQNDIVTNIFDINLKQNLDLFREKLIKEILKNNNFSSNFLFINKEKKEINKNFEKNLNINDIINENKITIVILPMLNIIKGQQFILSLNISINENLIFFRENINYHNFIFLDKNKNYIEKNNKKNKKIKDIIKGNEIYIEDDEQKTELILFNKNNNNNEK